MANGHLSEVLRVIALVCAQRDACLCIAGYLNSFVDLDFNRFPLGVTVGGAYFRIGYRSMAIVGKRIALINQTAGVVVLAVQPRVGIGTRCVCVVAARLAAKL